MIYASRKCENSEFVSDMLNLSIYALNNMKYYNNVTMPKCKSSFRNNVHSFARILYFVDYVGDKSNSLSVVIKKLVILEFSYA